LQRIRAKVLLPRRADEAPIGVLSVHRPGDGPLGSRPRVESRDDAAIQRPRRYCKNKNYLSETQFIILR
jgi:hypothetical protein